MEDSPLDLSLRLQYLWKNTFLLPALEHNLPPYPRMTLVTLARAEPSRALGAVLVANRVIPTFSDLWAGLVALPDLEGNNVYKAQL